MKKWWRCLREYMERSLRRQLVFYLVIGVLLPLTVVTTFLFMKAQQEMKKQAIRDIRQRSQVLANQVDELLYNIQAVSNTFAYDEEIEECLNKDYSEKDIEKLKDIYALNGYFLKTDPFGKNERLSAIYAKNGRVFNFLDPQLDNEEIKKKMLEMGAINREALSIFQWYPLQKNFLKAGQNENIRNDQVLIGVRRILHPIAGKWLYTQFFCMEENKLYQIYKNSVEEIRGEIYIIDQNGRLVSSSEEELVKTGSTPDELLNLTMCLTDGAQQIKYQEKDYIAAEKFLKNVSWKLIMMVPVKEATVPIDRLFKEIIVVMVICIVICVIIITWISKRFLQPVEVLDASMKEVYHGNLEAYVQPDSYHGEIKSMMTYYNAMLVQINHYIREKIESEKKKKELELEVLMGQINPHFLYNTLENIVWKSNEVGRPDIGRIAASLGRLYRLSIGNGETIVSIKQEVEHVMAYVNIQKNRYKERMTFDLRMNYDEVWGYSIIKLTLQPVVENCFMYAMESIDHVLKIRLAIKVEENDIRIVVADNGNGMTRDQLEKVREQIEHGKPHSHEMGKKRRKGTGIALYSVKERIALYTGYPHGLNIQSKKGMGTVVTIRVPKIPLKDKNNQ